MSTHQRQPWAPREPSPRRIRIDATAVLTLSVVAAVAVISLAISEFARRFVPGGIVWTLPIQAQEITAEGLTDYGADGAIPAKAVSGVANRIDVIVSGVNPISTGSLALAITVAAIAALIVIASTARVTWSVLRGAFFTRTTSRSLTTALWSGAGGAFAAFALWHFAANGVTAVLGVRAADTGSPTWWGWYWLVLFAFTAFGLVDIALRRAVRLQRETEGLV